MKSMHDCQLAFASPSCLTDHSLGNYQGPACFSQPSFSLWSINTCPCPVSCPGETCFCSPCVRFPSIPCMISGLAKLWQTSWQAAVGISVVWRSCCIISCLFQGNVRYVSIPSFGVTRAQVHASVFCGSLWALYS